MKCILVTGGYPFGTGETFLENEIEYIASSFEQVIIYVAITSHEMLATKRDVPDNVKIITSDSHLHQPNRLKFLLDPRYYRECIDELLCGNYVHRCKIAAAFLNTVYSSTYNIRKLFTSLQLKPDDKIVVYSYWMSRIGMTAIGIHNNLEKRGIFSKIITRCHGFDLYEERAYLHYLPYQRYLLSNFDYIYPCSRQGEDYLQKKYSVFQDKISHSYLGTTDHFTGLCWPKQKPFSVVSCSNVIPIKRVIKIAEALSEIKIFPILWTHFGDGELLAEIKEYANKHFSYNVKALFPGKLKNTEILNYYKNNSISVFVNVSSSEGLPVSIMEACSFGIPIIATDVGGTREIVMDGENGVLIHEQFEIQDLVHAIIHFAEMNQQEYERYCHASRTVYEKYFSAKNNYPIFCDKMKRILSG